MEAAHYAFCGAGFIVLHEVYRTHFLVELSLGIAFEEISSRIGKYAGFHYHYSLYVGFYYFHVIIQILLFAKFEVYVFISLCVYWSWID